MKTSNKITLVSVAGGLALVGTAFAAWQFNSTVTKTSASNVEITKKTSSGSIADVATIYLTLDQKGAYWTSVSYNDSEEDIDANDIVTSFNFVYTGSSDANDVSDVTLTVDFVADEGIATYVNFTGGELTNVTSENNVKQGVYNLPELSYTSAKPSTSSEYDVMKAALEGKKVTFTLTATVSE